MSVIITKRLSGDKQKYWYYIAWGKLSGERLSTKMFTYVEPLSQIQRNHNKETLAILENKKSKLTLKVQSRGTSYVPTHRMRGNFLEFYKVYLSQNAKPGNRHLLNSYLSFQKFIGRKEILLSELTPHLCEKYRNYLQNNLMEKHPPTIFHFLKRSPRGLSQGLLQSHPSRTRADDKR